MTEKAMFEDAQVGDGVWSVANGPGKIHSIDNQMTYPLGLCFDNGNIDRIAKCGRSRLSDQSPATFHSKIKFDVPPRPKRKVKKEVEFWCLFYHAGLYGSYDTETEAYNFADESCVGPAIRFTHTIEVDE
jgi:hypothetical protein